MLKKAAILAAISTSLLSGCSSTQTQNASEPPPSKLPSWIASPFKEGGLADTQCVPQTVNNVGVLRNKAIALARAELVKQISAKSKAMDKTYDNLTDSHSGSASGSSFEAVSLTLAEQAISGSRPENFDIVTFPDGVNYVCVMVTLAEDNTAALFNNMTQAADKQLSAEHNDILYQEFKAYKAHQELKQANNTGPDYEDQ